MRTAERAACSLAALALASVLSKLWVTSLSKPDEGVLEMLRRAERSRLRAERTRGTKHLAYALGMCHAARILLDDDEIEALTGIHMQSYEERLNAAMRQCATRRPPGRDGAPAAAE